MIGKRWRRQNRKVARLGNEAAADWTRVTRMKSAMGERVQDVGKPRFLAGSFVAGLLVGAAGRRGDASGSGSTGFLRLANSALLAWRMVHRDGVEDLLS